MFLAIMMLHFPLAVADALDIRVDETCSLRDAIRSANWDSSIGGCPAGDGIDQILLSQDITLAEKLPDISSMVAINGNGHTLSAADRYQHFAVKEDATLWLNNIVLSDGYGGYYSSIINRGHLIIQDSLIQDNHANQSAAVLMSRGNLTVRRSMLLDNRSGWHGIISSSGETTVEHSTISSNLGPAVNGGRTLRIKDSTISGNRRDTLNRAAIEMGEGHLNLDNSTVSDNEGGGISITGGSAFIDNSSIIGNFEGRGVSLYDARFAEISNSTISGNQSDSSGGGLYVGGKSDVTLQHVTLAYNKGESAGGIYRREGSIKLINSIIAGNQPVDCRAVLDQNISNLIEDGTCLPAHAGDPLLLPLTGDPAFHPLADGSPAINSADPDHCFDKDQTGNERPDTADGGCDIGAIESQTGIAAEPTPAPALCTLADAIRAANSDQPVGACPAGDGHDTIMLSDFISPEDYRVLRLKNELPAITSELTIEGNGNGISGRRKHRIFLVDGGRLTLKDIRLHAGSAIMGGAIHVRKQGSVQINDSSICYNYAEEYGGAISAEDASRLIIRGSVICDNETREGLDYRGGGGIAISDGSTLELIGSDLYENVSDDHGGAIYSKGAIVNISDSRISRNESRESGGAISAEQGSKLSIARSAIVDNRTGLGAGGIELDDATMDITNSTISGNLAQGYDAEFSSSGGGISASNSKLSLIHVTLSDNRADHVAGLHVSSYKDPSEVMLINSILAGNAGDDCYIGDRDHLKLSSATLVQDGACQATLLGDPQIGFLKGSHPHHPLRATSPAINAADAAHCPATDQLGRPRPQAGGCDIGAIESALELQPTPAPTVCTLFDQIVAANRDAAYGACPAGEGADTIVLKEDIVLSEALPQITSAITVEGQGFSISGANAHRIFNVVAQGKLALNNLILRDGDAWNGGAIRVARGGELVLSSSEIRASSAMAGGAIVSYGHLTIRDSSFRNNRSKDVGGAIGTVGVDAHLSIDRSSFVGNRAESQGGAISSHLSDAQVTNTTFSGNSARVGGGIAAVGSLEEHVSLSLKHVTMTDNTAHMGAALSSGANVYIRNSIVTGSISIRDCYILWATSTNIIEDDECLDVIKSDPKLDDLSGENLHHPPLEDSPAINVADPDDCPPLDQLGNLRMQDGVCDLGAVEYHENVALPSHSSNDACSLADQIRAANTDQAVSGCPAGDDADTIILDREITLSNPLPAITSVITIDGRGHSINGANRQRIFRIEGGALTINDLTLTNGNALRGGAILVRGGNLHLNRSTICGHDATFAGGAIYAEAASTLTIRRSTLCVNGTVAWDANGGAIYLDKSSTLDMVKAEFDDNHTQKAGGAIYSRASTLNINDSAFTNNRSGYSGGAIAAEAESALSIRASAVVDNSTDALGGGIMIEGFSTLDMLNSTVAGNDDWQGSWETDSRGGGIYSRDSDVTLTHVSFVANLADKGSGLYASGNLDTSKIRLFNTFLESNNSSCHFEPLDILKDSTGSIADYKSCHGINWDWLRVERHLLTPPYYSLREDSPAIDAADPRYCPPTDQLGNPRPQGDGCDVGALEYTGE
ncbi:MAG: hypothetical protein OXG39_14985 [Chloroflexi bacterium]|nr:hypothetical protein [Chloroflexota bacterium]